MRTSLFLIFLLTLTTTTDLWAQKKKKKKTKGNTKTEVKKTDSKSKPKSNKKDIKASTKKDIAFEGLFTFYQDSTSGVLKMKIDSAQINQEFIHFYYIENGLVEAGAFRGNFRGSRIFKIEKYFDKINFVLQNTSTYFDPSHPISRAADANISNSIIYSTKIIASDSGDQAFLISVDGLFMSEAFGYIKWPSSNPNAFSLGKMNRGKSRYDHIRSYPENSDVVISYAFENFNPKNRGSNAVTDARNMTVKVQHSLIEMPNNGYKIRRDDPRVGYFMTQVNDMTSHETLPYRDMIHRWHLEKKNPELPISEPIKPITYWIENTTPYQIRSIIKKAGERWNEAFESAGFKNALVIKEQPDTADWDAGDIRYNVLRWTASPRTPFSGYGPSFVNPRTGEILGADIMLEFTALNWSRYEETFDLGSHLSCSSQGEDDTHRCRLGHELSMTEKFGEVVGTMLDYDSILRSKLRTEYIHYLIIHEIGHTLGLNHNMKASNLHSLEDVHNEEITEKVGLLASVMDYPSVNIAPEKSMQGQFYTTRPGPYDHWAITYGYAEMDENQLDSVLNQSTRPELMFGNDADDMRSIGKGLDPRTNIFDLSNDVIGYSEQRVALCKKVLANMQIQYDKQGEGYDGLRMRFYLALGEQARAANVVSRFVGGVYLDRAMVGQEGATKPFTPVEETKQRRAMSYLSKNVFAPDAFQAPSKLYNYLLNQRRGFSGASLPKIHDAVLGYQKNILSHLLNSSVLKKMVDAQQFGNTYTVAEMMNQLNDAIFKIDASKSVNTFRQNLQIEYVDRLIYVLKSDRVSYVKQAKAMALKNLRKIDQLCRSTTGNSETRAHRQYLRYTIAQALDEK